MNTAGITLVRVVLPVHLDRLARSGREVALEVGGRPTAASVLDALEARHPALRGTIRDHVTRKRRPFIRFYACGEDVSNVAPETPLPDDVASGREPFLIVGAMAGG
jgi:hypothetical protein